MVMELTDPKGTWSKSSEEVRRSLDVLDKVLSEFDDIDGYDEDLFEVDQTVKDDKSKNPEGTISPPPVIDRTLKPQDTPPALPKKEGKALHLLKKRDITAQDENSPPDSLKRSTSEASSHEYQEINSDLCPSRRSKSLTRSTNTGETLFRPVKPLEQDTSLKEKKVSCDGHRGRPRAKDNVIQKSRSRDTIPGDSKHPRENIQKRKIAQRRSKSSEKVFNQRRKPQSFSHPGNHTSEHYIPEQFDQIPVDPRLLDPRFLNTIPLDPRLRHKFDQMLLREPIPYLPQFNTIDGGAYLSEDQIPFPHLLHNPNIPLRMPPPAEMPYYPEDIPSDILDPNFLPPMIPNGYIPMDPMDFSYQYPIHLDNLDPSFVARDGMYPPEYPFDMPLEYYGVDPMNYPIPNEKFGYPMQRIPPYLDKNLPLHEIERMWIASQQDQMALNNLRNLQHMTADHLRNAHGERMKEMNELNNLHRLHYSGNNSGIDRTEMRKSFERNRLRRSASRGVPVQESLSSDTSFRVGEAVKCLDEGEEIMSPTNFSSGGKDSGFDETPPIDDLTHKERKSPHPGTGGGFIVSGVFNDSSKMYIPAPPSPTPDYDEKCSDSEGGESDILQSSLYHVKPKVNPKSRKDNISDSLSDDSLQDTSKTSKKEEKTKSLQTMIKEFHNGLPTAVPEPYSDDSLDESSASPSRPSSIGVKSRRIMSVESLTSIDGSTTSFDYIKGGSSKSGSKKKQNMKRHSSYFSEKTTHVITPDKSSAKIRKEDPKKESQKKQKKFDTIRNLIKEGLLEGLDELPPDFKPPPASNDSLEKNDSGVSSRSSTTKTNESANSSPKSNSSSFSDNADSKTRENRKSKIKDPAPQPPTELPSRQNSRSPGGQSWLHKQKRQAPIPDEASTKLKQDRKEKITHVDDIPSTNGQVDQNNSICSDGRYRPLLIKDECKSDKRSSYSAEGRRKESMSQDTLDSRINHPTFSGPLIPPELKSPGISKQKKASDDIKRTPISMTYEGSSFKETNEKDSNSKPAKRCIEINSSPLNNVMNKYSQKDTKGSKVSYPLSKSFNDSKQSNSSWSPKFGEESSKSRFNIFKGFWRRNKYSFDKF